MHPKKRRTVPRFHLAASDNLEAAPSIGPKTAQRFAEIGVITVADFLAARRKRNGQALEARALAAPHSARLAGAGAAQLASVPRLRGTHAQVAASERISRCGGRPRRRSRCALSPPCWHLLKSETGQKILREGRPPDCRQDPRSGSRTRRAYAEAASVQSMAFFADFIGEFVAQCGLCLSKQYEFNRRWTVEIKLSSQT